MAYITKYDTTAEYEAATLDKPHVALTEDDSEVHFDDSSWIRLWALDGDTVTMGETTYQNGEKIYVTGLDWTDDLTTNIGAADLNHLDVSDVTSLRLKFCSDCIKYVKCLDLRNWDVSKVTDMYCCFANMPNITYIDISGWKTSNVTEMRKFIRACGNLVAIDMTNFDWTNVTGDTGDSWGSFTTDGVTNCSNLRHIYGTETWGESKINGNCTSFFQGCSKLEELNLGNWKIAPSSIGWWYNGMFCGCSSLKELDISGMDLSACTTPGSFCRSCTSLEKVILGTQDWTNWNTGGMEAVSESKTGSGSMDYHPFYYDTKLTTLEGTIENLGKCYYDYAHTVSYRLFLCCPLTEESALVVLNGLYDMTGSSSVLTMIFSKTTYDLLTEEDIAIGTNKNWCISYDSKY